MAFKSDSKNIYIPLAEKDRLYIKAAIGKIEKAGLLSTHKHIYLIGIKALLKKT